MRPKTDRAGSVPARCGAAQSEDDWRTNPRAESELPRPISANSPAPRTGYVPNQTSVVTRLRCQLCASRALLLARLGLQSTIINHRSDGRIHTRLLWNVLCPAMSASMSGVVQLTFVPPSSLAQRPLGETTTPGRVASVTTARNRHEPRPLYTRT